MTDKTKTGNSTYIKSLRYTGVKLGALGQSLDRNDAAFTDWLVANTPEGGTLSEAIVAIALDVYYEEMEG